MIRRQPAIFAKNGEFRTTISHLFAKQSKNRTRLTADPIKRSHEVVTNENEFFIFALQFHCKIRTNTGDKLSIVLSTNEPLLTNKTKLFFSDIFSIFLLPDHFQSNKTKYVYTKISIFVSKYFLCNFNSINYVKKTKKNKHTKRTLGSTFARYACAFYGSVSHPKNQ